MYKLDLTDCESLRELYGNYLVEVSVDGILEKLDSSLITPEVHRVLLSKIEKILPVNDPLGPVEFEGPLKLKESVDKTWADLMTNNMRVQAQKMRGMRTHPILKDTWRQFHRGDTQSVIQSMLDVISQLAYAIDDLTQIATTKEPVDVERLRDEFDTLREQLNDLGVDV